MSPKVLYCFKQLALLALLGAGSLLAACPSGVAVGDEPGPGEGEGEPAEGEGEGEPAEGEGEGEPDGTACSILSVRCASCHDGGDTAPDLRPEAQAALVNAPSPGYPAEVLVVPGDADASFLFKKMMGTQAPGQRGDMPPSGTLVAAELDAVRAWIESGAPDECNGVTPPPPPPPPTPLEPGGDISGHISDPSLVAGFTSTVPSGATGTCSTNQWWQLRDLQSERMHPGRACLECHRSEGEGPRNGYLGTVQQAVDDADDCRGVGDVLVEILNDATGAVVASDTTNSAGNFIIESSFAEPYRVRLSLDGRTREMLEPQTDGDCMGCHTPDGADGAPGRIVAP